MKKLSELGISPMPWKARKVSREEGFTDFEVYDDNGNYVLFDGDAGCANCNFIAAAPELYEVIWNICFGNSTTVNCAKCGGNDHGDGIEHCSKDCPLYKARAALAKASGII